MHLGTGLAFPRASTGVRRVAPAGFTLTETLISISMIGVLLALLIPALAHHRTAAKHARALSLLSSHATVFNQYTSDYRGFMPYFTRPDGVVNVQVDSIPLSVEYFDAHVYWHVFLAESLYATHWTDPRFTESGRARIATTFWYSAAFLADPAFWARETRVGPEQWRAVNASEISFPDRKAMHLASSYWFSKKASGAMLGFVDGSAQRVSDSELVAGYPQGTGAWPGSTITYAPPGVCTIHGSRGRDRR